MEEILQFRKSSSLENNVKHCTLIEDAKIEKLVNEEHMRKMNRDCGVGGEEGVDETIVGRYMMIFEVEKDAKLSPIFSSLEKNHGDVTSVQKRNSKSDTGLQEVMVEFRGSSRTKAEMVKWQGDCVGKVVVKKLEADKALEIVVPRCMEDLDKCNHLVDKFESSLDEQHPGFRDPLYRARKEQIVKMAYDYKSGGVIASVEYSEEEVKTWKYVFEKLKSLYKTHACKQHLDAMEIMEKEGIYTSSQIPQLEDVSRFLKNKTGFQLRPVGGILSARDFLASLAFRVFQSTQYVRHPSRPEYSIEPDCIHELLGHVPMLADAEFANFSHQIGLASLGASDAEIEKLATLYWFTVEYGVCREDGEMKAYGAGLLTSFGELQYALTDKPKKVPFNLDTVTVQPYDDNDFQEMYFVADSFEEMKNQVRNFTKKMDKGSTYRFNPYTHTIHDLSLPHTFNKWAKEVMEDFSLLCNTFETMQ